ncbi:MAG: hypothetical protein B9S32_13730 [Verrucomicrobia bacterium Tous-C9LFEB]|nr:MAG: hypothetical protein B9S32_13730 [Verrucomicrobia bacterium Tous-C9LFEB]
MRILDAKIARDRAFVVAGDLYKKAIVDEFPPGSRVRFDACWHRSTYRVIRVLPWSFSTKVTIQNEKTKHRRDVEADLLRKMTEEES